VTRLLGRWAGRLASVALLAFVAGAAAFQANAAAPERAAKGGARLESMKIEIWPEYDRPAALVILRGELAADVNVPAAISLRIPASSGGPAAVAYAAEKKGQLLNLPHERTAAGDFIALRFTLPARSFHVEFYDRIDTSTSARSYRFLWPGDLPVSWLDLVVQEPAGASALSIQPVLNEKATGSDGLQYHSAQLGPAKQGTPLPIEIQYTKSDPRTSAEILKLGAPPPPAEQVKPVEAKSTLPLYLAMGGVALLTIAAVVSYVLLQRRQAPPKAGAAGSAVFCAKCGNRAGAGDRFCAKCGKALA
jgi:hypothetical protein